MCIVGLSKKRLTEILGFDLGFDLIFDNVVLVGKGFNFKIVIWVFFKTGLSSSRCWS